VIEREVLPAIGSDDGSVHFDVERVELGNVGDGVVGVLESAPTI
jgi:hypothetical protein